MNEGKILFGISMVGLVFIGLGFMVSIFGAPNFSNVEEQAQFCVGARGVPVSPSRQNYNTLLCMFTLDENGTEIDMWGGNVKAGTYTSVEYVVNKIDTEKWAKIYSEHYQKEINVGDYCFGCWDSRSCESPHNDVLRERGLHC